MKHSTLSTITFLITFSAFGQWNLSSFVPTTQYEVDFPAANAAYVAGYEFVYKSTDGGITWNQILDLGPFANFSDLSFINADTGFVNLYGTFYRTFDGGTSWNTISGNGGQSIKITGEKLFASYASNDTTYIVRSDNYGTNWVTLYQRYEISALPYLFSFIDSINGYFINPNELEQVYKTNDGCVSFDTLFITTGPLVLQAEYDFKDLQNGYLYGSWGSQSHPTRTWNSGNLYYPIDLDGFGVLPVLDLDFNTSKLYASSLYGKIFYSLDNGGDWTEQITPISNPINSISFLNANQGIAVSGQDILYTNNGGFTGFEEAASIASFIDVYPNPAVSELNIRNNSSQQLRFILCNALGEEIIDIMLTDNTSVLDFSSYTDGIYFYKAIEHNNKITTGKIVKQ